MTEYERELARLGPNAAARIDRVHSALKGSVTAAEYQRIHPTITSVAAFENLERRLASEGRLSPEAVLDQMYPTMTKGR